MDVMVRYFAAAAEAAGRDEEVLRLPEGATLADLSGELEGRYGDTMAVVLRSGSFLVDHAVCRDRSRPVAEAVDVLPPFAGG